MYENMYLCMYVCVLKRVKLGITYFLPLCIKVRLRYVRIFRALPFLCLFAFVITRHRNGTRQHKFQSRVRPREDIDGVVRRPRHGGAPQVLE